MTARIAAKPRLPERVADHRDTFVVGERQPSEHRRGAERGKQRVGKTQGHPNTLDAVADPQRVGERIVDGEVFDEALTVRGQWTTPSLKRPNSRGSSDPGATAPRNSRRPAWP